MAAPDARTQKAIVERTHRALVNTRSLPDAIDALQAAARDLGFAGLVYWSYVRDVGGAIRANTYIYHARGPSSLAGLEQAYAHLDIASDDCVLVVQNSHVPVRSRDVYTAPDCSQTGRLVWSMMNAYGIHHDLNVPVHTPRRTQAVWFFALGEGTEVAGDVAAVADSAVQVARLFAISAGEFVQVLEDAAQGTVLSEREAECLKAVASGLTNPQIARRLDITERTVKFHVQNIMRKLNAGSRSEAVAIAVASNLVRV